MRDLVSYGEVRRAWVGLVVQDLTPQLSQHFGTQKGVVVVEVEPRSPAAGAGIARGDVITRVDGHDVRSRDEFEERLAARSAGETVTVTRRRDESEQEIRIAASGFSDADADDLAWRLVGVGVRATDDGLEVERVRSGSPAARIGIEKGDRLLGLGGVALNSMSEFHHKMVELRAARDVLVTIGRGPFEYNVNLPTARE
jgi:S1-C subfamily serine protease